MTTTSTPARADCPTAGSTAFGTSFADAVAIDDFVHGTDDGNPNTPVVGTFGASGAVAVGQGPENRFYALEVLAPGDTISIDAVLDFVGFDNGFIDIRLYDPTQTEIASTGFSDASQQLLHEFAAAGTYYLEIELTNFSFEEAPHFAFEAELSSTRPLTANRLIGGQGNDQYVVYSATDQVVEGAGQGTADRISAAVSYVLGAGVAVEILETAAPGATAAIDLTGNELANRITGNAGGNTLDGGGGDDVIAGGAGNDVLRGRTGNDVLDGGAGADLMRGHGGDDRFFVDQAGDTVVELAGDGIDRVTATIDYALGAEVENLVLRGAAQAGTGNGARQRDARFEREEHARGSRRGGRDRRRDRIGQPRRRRRQRRAHRRRRQGPADRRRRARPVRVPRRRLVGRPRGWPTW